MPLLGIFKKSNSRSKVSAAASSEGHSGSNISLNDDDFVSVESHNRYQPGPSSITHPARYKYTQQLQPNYPGLLEPPPDRSSLFNLQDDHSVHGSTQSLPDHGDRQAPRLQQPVPENFSSSLTNVMPKKFMFNWKSSKSRPPPSPHKQESSFNLKSFRHVRPESPASPSTPISSSAPIPPPIPTTAAPSSPVSFQVTSRRPRGNSVSGLTVSTSHPDTASQQKIPVGVFLQAARRSSSSLPDTPVQQSSAAMSPARSSLDERSPSFLLPRMQAEASTPTRPVPVQPKSPSEPKPSARPQPPISMSKSPRAPASISSPPRKRTNAFANTSSSSSEEEDEEDSDSTDDGAGLARKATIKPRPRVLPPLSASVRQQIQRATPPTEPVQPRAHSTMGVYGAGARSRASLSVGALTPSAKEARASVAATDSRMLGTSRSLAAPSALPISRRSASDLPEPKSDSESSDDEPLSSLVLPRHSGTHSSRGAPRKPLVNLDTPSTMTGRPLRAPPPMDRGENTSSKAHGSSGFSPQVGQQDSQSSKGSLGSPPRALKTPQGSPNAKGTQAHRRSISADTQASWYPDSKNSPAHQSSRLSPQTSQPFDRRSSRVSSFQGVSMGPASRSSLSPAHVAPPSRPFARRESPASSTGDSSSGKAPLTPRDGSDLGGTTSILSEPASRGRHGQRRRPSVTFEDEQGRDSGNSNGRGNGEARLRERRRNEARAAIELGNVVNGPPPVDEDDDVPIQNPGVQMAWPQSGMQNTIPPVPPMFNMGMNMSMPSSGAFGFGVPPPAMDPAYLAAHQQAMAIAKQTFQYAVAQQALAAANEEWERNSNTGWGGSQWGGGSSYGLGMGGLGMGVGVGMGMGMRNSAVFPPAPRSMYAGSIGGGGGVGAWGGTGSVYGEGFGPARQPIYPQGDISAQQRNVRPRTKTAPSSPAPPVGAGRRLAPPPSSFRGVAQ